MKDEIAITVIATGFESASPFNAGKIFSDGLGKAAAKTGAAPSEVEIPWFLRDKK